MRKFPCMINFRNVIGVGMKQHACRYWMRSVFVMSLVTIVCDLCLNGIEMGMYHNPFDLFQCPFNDSLESLRI